MKKDIIDLILDDHKVLKALIKILKDTDADLGKRSIAFEEFAPLLSLHAKPEEQSLYAFMKENSALEIEALEGDAEHAIADLLIHEIYETKDKAIWSAKTKVLAELVDHHILEEENKFLPHFKENSDEEIRSQLGQEFLYLKKVVGHSLPLRKVLGEEIYWEQGLHS